MGNLKTKIKSLLLLLSVSKFATTLTVSLYDNKIAKR
jgi:hypothetical protein